MSTGDAMILHAAHRERQVFGRKPTQTFQHQLVELVMSHVTFQTLGPQKPEVDHPRLTKGRTKRCGAPGGVAKTQELGKEHGCGGLCAMSAQTNSRV